MSISEYLASVRHAIKRLDTYGFAESIIFQKEIRAGKQAIIKAEIVLVVTDHGACNKLELPRSCNRSQGGSDVRDHNSQ